MSSSDSDIRGKLLAWGLREELITDFEGEGLQSSDIINIPPREVRDTVPSTHWNGKQYTQYRVNWEKEFGQVSPLSQPPSTSTELCTPPAVPLTLPDSHRRRRRESDSGEEEEEYPAVGNRFVNAEHEQYSKFNKAAAVDSDSKITGILKASGDKGKSLVRLQGGSWDVLNFTPHKRAERSTLERSMYRCYWCPYVAVEAWRFKEHVVRVHPPCPSSRVADDMDLIENFDIECDSQNYPQHPSDLPLPSQQDPSLMQIPTSNSEISSMLSYQLGSIVADSMVDTGVNETNVQFFMERFMHYQQSVASLALNGLYNRYSTIPPQRFSSCCNGVLTDFVNDFKTILEDAYKPMRSIHSRLSYFTKLGTFIPPREYSALNDAYDDRNLQEVRLPGDRDIHIGDHKNESFIFVPMRSVLKKIFEIPGLLKEVVNWAHACSEEPEVLSFMESQVWLESVRKREHAKPGSLFFPLHVYWDEFEVRNALGSHSGIHKLSGVYFSLPFLPPRLASTLKFKMLVSVFYARVRTLQGNRAVFKPVIDELKFLYEEGITVNLESGESVVIQFALGCLVGDNLGLNSMLGFTSSFSAGRCCRICCVHKDDFGTTLTEDPALLRTKENVLEQLYAGNPSATGVTGECVWNRLPYFRIETHCSVDFMHDMFEGVARYTMLVVLKGLVIRNRAFDLPYLNDRIENLEYGPDRGTRPLSISAVGGHDFSIRLSASEMRTFVAYFGLMVGHKVEVEDYDPPDDDELPPPLASSTRRKPPNPFSARKGDNGRKVKKCSKAPGVAFDPEYQDSDEFYILYILLNRVITAISVDSVSKSKARYLAHEIGLFLKHFFRCSSKLSYLPEEEGGVTEAVPPSLQPKFHFLIHYPSMMMKHGPLPALSIMRFESKNKEMKAGLKNSFNNINTPFTAAKKEQYHLNHLFFHNTLPSNMDNHGKLMMITDPDERLQVTSALGIDPHDLRKINYVVTGTGIKFRPDYAVCVGLIMGLPKFSKIESLYFDIRNQETYFKGSDYETSMFSPHFQAYSLDPLNSYSFYKLSERLYALPDTILMALDYNYYALMRNPL